MTTGGHFFNNAVQSNFILSVPFMQAASKLLSSPNAKGGRGKTSPGAGEVEAAQQRRVQRRRLSCFSEELEEEKRRK